VGVPHPRDVFLDYPISFSDFASQEVLLMKKLYFILALVLIMGLVCPMTAITISAAKPGRRVQIPRIDKKGGWSSWIQVQNVGDEETGAVVFFWGAYSGLCPTNDPGPIDHACMSIPENGVWTLKGTIPAKADSAIVYSVDRDLFGEACEEAGDALGDTAAWRRWKNRYEGTGQPLAVTVNRAGPNDFGTTVSSTYVGIDETMEGRGPPYSYFAAYLMKAYHNLDTEMAIQNSGRHCTSVWIYYQEQGICRLGYAQHIQQLAPGEAVRVRVPRVPELGDNSDWLGCAYITADQPLGIIVDQTSFPPSADRAMLLTCRANPYKDSEGTTLYADLIYRELGGWSASIQVQNLTQYSQPAFVTVEFLDNSGGSILFLSDWICANGSMTFYLPAIIDLGFNYVGAAVIHSRDQPIFAVVDLKHPSTKQGGSYNAHAKHEGESILDIALPSLNKDHQGVTSLIAIRNNSNSGVTVELEISDQTGTIVTKLPSFWLPPSHVKAIDLARIGSLVPGFVGAGRVEVIGSVGEVMISTVVAERGSGPGDITRVYEGIPVIE